jgi:hypothetical protein
VASLRDKVCVTTSGAGGVGLATAQVFLNRGAKVMLGLSRAIGATQEPSSTNLFRLDAMGGRWKLPKPFCILLSTGAASPPAVHQWPTEV